MKQVLRLAALATLAVVAMPMLAYNAADVPASATYAEGTHDLGVLTPGVTYEFPEYTAVAGEYTPSVTGPVKIFYTANPLTLYTSKAYDDASFVEGTHSYVTGGQMISYESLEAGKTYYIYSNFTMSAGSLKIQEGSAELAVTAVSPKLEAGEYFSVSDNYTIDISFNAPITVTSAWLIAGEARSQISCTVSNTSVSCSVSDAIMEFYRSGALKKDDKMMLRLMGVTDAADPENKYNANGKYEVEFLMADKPAELVKIINAERDNLNNPFLSYYPSGDEAGKVSFVFDKALAADKTPYGKITYGNPDNIDLGIYTESVPGVNTAETAMFDFTGKLRRPIDMIPGSTADSQPTNLHILFADIFSADGQRVFTGRAANPSGFSLSFKLNVIQYTYSSDFTPVRGSDIAPGTEMEIWLMNGAYIECKGISFDYVSGGEPARVVVPMAEVKAEPDPLAESDMIFTFKVPEMNVDDNTKITVSLADAVCADGLDHAADFTAEFGYKTTGIESVENGESLKSVDVYDIAGVCVLKNVSRSALRTLPKGLYIVNGKKIAIN